MVVPRPTGSITPLDYVNGAPYLARFGRKFVQSSREPNRRAHPVRWGVGTWQGNARKLLEQRVWILHATGAHPHAQPEYPENHSESGFGSAKNGVPPEGENLRPTGPAVLSHGSSDGPKRGLVEPRDKDAAQRGAELSRP